MPPAEKNSPNPLSAEGIVLKAPVSAEFREILSDDALRFLAKLHRKFNSRRLELLAARKARQQELSAGRFPSFLPETRFIRDAEWKVAAIPKDLSERKVEITGPVDRKMIVNALNSGANVFMADFEDSNAPTWANNIQGQINLRDTVRRTITFVSPEGKKYQLKPETATLMVRPRGWHLFEKHLEIDGVQMSASLFDFGLFFFHNSKQLIKNGTGPYFYLPKMESHLEARLWNDVFLLSQQELGLPRGVIRATVLIETILAAFEMDEILYELKDHSAGLNCGRWDYIFSFIKKFGTQKKFLLPDRGQVTMDKAFLRAYVELLIKTCHRRGIHAMGGMAPQIPIKDNPAANETAMEKVRNDKLREVKAGHDGTWVAHPGLIPVALEVFNGHMDGPHQLHVKREEVDIGEQDLLQVPEGTITEQGLRLNLNVALIYIESWLRGIGCVPIYNLMEDAATAEISRTQVWQWIRHGARLSSGTAVTLDLVKKLMKEEAAKVRELVGPQKFDGGRFADAAKILESLISAAECPEFLTTAAYDYLE